jgi:methyl-accepting chemotaxis protein
MSQQLEVLNSNDDVKNLQSIDKRVTSIPIVISSLKAIKDNTEEAANVFYATEYGDVLIDSGLKTENDIKYKDKEWYTKAKEKNGEITYSKPYKDAVTGGLVITASKAVKDNGKFVGALGIDIKLDNMEQYVKNIVLLKQGYVLFADMDGNIIIGNDKNSYDKTNISKFSFWQNVKNEASGVTEWKNESNQKLYIAQKSNKETGWKIIAFLNENEVIDNVKSTKTVIIITMIISLIIAALLAIYITMVICREIKKINESIRLVANGSFKGRINVTSNTEFGELGENFNTMLDSVSNLMRNVESTSLSLFDASNNISSMAEETTASVSEVVKAITEVSNGATNQAQGAQSAAESVKKLSDKMEEIKNNTNMISGFADQTEKLSTDGLNMLNSLVNISNKTKENAIESTNIVNNMTDSIEKINFISETIAGITEQTNLLSLNASIEAARVGEMGKGFAVVAEEIRKLADESKQSTNDIKTIIEEINKKSIAAGKAMIESTKMLENQDEAVDNTRNVFKNILASIDTLITGVKNIQSLNVNMDKDRETVNINMENIAAISEETAASSQEVTASTEEVNATMDELTRHADDLQIMANQLREEIRKFELD